MVSSPAVVDAVIVAEYVPSPLSVVEPKVTSPLVLNVTVSPATGLENASVTVAVAVDVDRPSAVIVAGYVPAPLSVVEPKVTSPLVLNVTVSPATGLENASVTVAVAVVVATPSAVIVSGARLSEGCAAAPACSCSVAVPVISPS